MLRQRSRASGDLARRFATYGAVGASGTALNLVLFWFLTTSLHAHYVLAAPLAFELSLLSNFVLNDRLTFGDRCTRANGFIDLTALLRYQLTALGGLAISLIVLHATVAGVGLPPLLANLLGIGCATMWTFTLSLRWAWQPHRATGESLFAFAHPA